MKIMKIIVRGILQKLLKYWTIRRRDDYPSNPATQRIILEIDWFLEKWLSHSNLFHEKYFNNDDKTNKSGLSGPCCVAYHC